MLKTADKNEKHLLFGGCDTVALAKKYGTPLYVISEEHIRERCREIQRDFLLKYNRTKAFYASKAFLTMKMCRIISEEGLGLDVVSGGELFTAIKAGFPMDDVIFHGNNKSLEEIELALSNDVGRIAVDNLDELAMIQEAAERLDKKTKILFRISPGIEAGDTHEYIFTGHKDSKFGIPLEQNIIKKAIADVMNSSHMEFMGFHFHVGSQLFRYDSHVAAVHVLIRLMEYIKNEMGVSTQELNIGGGFGIRYVEEDESKPLSFFVDAIMESIIQGCENANIDVPLIMIEPGRWIVGEAGITLYTIGSIKEIPGIRTYISVDGGMPDNPRPALYQAKYRAVVANKMGQELEKQVTVAGKCCESGDILIENIKLPKIESGDILAVFSTGAYNYSMSSNYNRLPRPAVVLVNSGNDELMVKRESYEDLIRNEMF